MRVLTIGNMYPPHHLGGYELVWQSAVRHLRGDGHRVRVLTTDFRLDLPMDEEDEDVHRELRWYWRDHAFPRLGPRERLALERHNWRVLRRHLGEVEPAVVSWWAMGGMSLSLIERVRRLGAPAVGVVHDEWMVYGPKVDGWLRMTARLGPLAPLAGAIAGPPTRIRFGEAGLWLFNSEAMRRHALATGLDLPRTGVVHPGIDRSRFAPAPETPWRGRLLCLGRIDPRKGIATAIGALKELPDARLTVAGEGDRDHLAELRVLARDPELDGRVEFTHLDRDHVASAYAEADAVLFPVLWEEPWGLVPLEAMAVGTPVIATGAGGSGEYLRDGDNCLIFEPRDDSSALARAIGRLRADGELRRRLREGGLETAARFDEASFNEAIARELEGAAP